jgi:hypothetical protein
MINTIINTVSEKRDYWCSNSYQYLHQGYIYNVDLSYIPGVFVLEKSDEFDQHLREVITNISDGEINNQVNDLINELTKKLDPKFIEISLSVSAEEYDYSGDSITRKIYMNYGNDDYHDYATLRISDRSFK